MTAEPEPGTPVSEEAPLYAMVRQGGAKSSLWMITWNEGWRSGILCSGMYTDDARFLLRLLGRRPRGR